ncbi:MAG: hypothetical protein EHM61_27385 [Acidobacteria bacterium]|nr:MAG: hypothetical protein EHM61_27385 [Acidobacteriota bacterium]
MPATAIRTLPSWFGLLAAFAAGLASPQSEVRFDSASPASWAALSSLPSGTPVIIYLKNGARRQETLLRVTDLEIVTHVGPIRASDIAAISHFRPERLWDGALRGAGIGIATGSIIAASAEDTQGGAWAVSTVFGSLAGAGFGALFDSAVAKPDKQIFLDAPPGSARPGIRHWTLKVRPEDLSAWTLGKTVHVMLKDGTYLRGKVTSGNESSILIALREASDRPKEKEGRTVSVSEVGTVIVREKLGGSTAAAGVGGGLAGFWGGAAAGAFSSDGSDEGQRALLGACLGGLIGTTTAIAGTDRLNWREITLVVQ